MENAALLSWATRPMTDFFFKLVVKVWFKLPVDQFNTKEIVSFLITLSLNQGWCFLRQKALI